MKKIKNKIHARPLEIFKKIFPLAIKKNWSV
jgi:hypothetical protein